VRAGTASRSIEPGCTIASTTDADVSGDGPVDEAPSLSSASSVPIAFPSTAAATPDTNRTASREIEQIGQSNHVTPFIEKRILPKGSWKRALAHIERLLEARQRARQHVLARYQ
jgi:hypothetical protein